MKKKIVIISVAAVLSIVVVLIIIFTQKDSFSLKINGREIGKEEFLEAAARERYEVVSYFSEKGSGGVGEKFWEEEIGGELPYEKLTQETLGELKHFYAVYGLAEEKGYTFIHPFDDLAVATGQGTIAMEIFKDLPLVEYILVPIGGGCLWLVRIFPGTIFGV